MSKTIKHETIEYTFAVFALLCIQAFVLYQLSLKMSILMGVLFIFNLCMSIRSFINYIKIKKKYDTPLDYNRTKRHNELRQKELVKKYHK